MVRVWQAVAILPLQAPRSAWDPRLLLLSLALIGGILVAAVVLYLLKRWRTSLNEPEEACANDQLSQFRELYDQGQLSQEEFDRIRNLLADRIRQEMEVPVPTPAPAVRGTPPALPPGPTPPSTG